MGLPLALLSLSLFAATPTLDLEAATRLLPGAADCGDAECVIERAYGADEKARALALALWRETGDLAGLGKEEQMDGGFRGPIHLVPQLPTGRYRKHLAWVLESAREADRFFGALFAGQPEPRYRWRGLGFRFVRSVGGHRPSAYATGWDVEYNVEGSLMISQTGVRDTLFHELFHLNDDDHGDWSGSHLRADYQAILAQCGPKPKLTCLAPFAPNDTLVRGGTYYAFQQNNGDTVHEYAAELAVRYFKEQSEMLAHGKLTRRAFKCGPAQNGRAWQGLVAEFFGGRDLVPACTSVYGVR